MSCILQRQTYSLYRYLNLPRFIPSLIFDQSSTNVNVNRIEARGAHASKFSDIKRIQFIGGTGGDGCISFMHLFANEFAGPDGGDGGSGGHVVLIADRHIKSLGHLNSSYRGEPGASGQGKSMVGKNGKHLYVNVPIGTYVYQAGPKDIQEEAALLADKVEKEVPLAFLEEDQSMFIAARGGGGGRGNQYYLSNMNRHPRIAQAGAKGEHNVYRLEMKLYAHIGLVGFPNAGKSTLLRNLTRANVQIGDYPFTTLCPQVGIIEYDDYVQIAVSDLPGIIEDSHKNRGLGLQFLRHIDKCVCLLYVIDLSGPNPVQQFEQLRHELECYRTGLSRRPHAVVGNKIDLEQARENENSFERYLKDLDPNILFMTISGKDGLNTDKLVAHFRKMYDEYYQTHQDEPDALVW